MKKLTKKFNAISVKKGETFAIELASNPSTGFTWDIKFTSGTATLLERDFKPSAPRGMAGAGGKEIFTYVAEKDGTIEIDAYYRRSWEKNLPPAKTCNFKVSVR